MLRFQIALAIIFIGCIAFVSCGRDHGMLETVVDDTVPDMGMDMHKSWTDFITLPAPTMTVEEAAAAMNPGGTGAAHGMGSRTVYFNEVGAGANKDETTTMYPAGTMIVKEVMDVTEMFVMQVVTMTKTDDEMYAAHNGWMYGAIQRASADEELMMPHQLSVEMAQGCHDCHAKASNDSVFVSLSMGMDDMDDMDDMDGMDDMDDGMNGNGNGNGQ